ncbi:hypothetical protein HMPREF9443_01422 [Phascolarctobacterium succinatutens YIT 12067]|uniref:Uncharacterized protein n=1 Tax=Phascolarctobacterium succinatutens YIT 12067 TaxID=626939 RepID=E8LEY8_9FIRM|nr:hypothetical protein HMPREF9443_01422 [Phascolarctobacterium succinatutens YIT 12067]
MVSQPTKIIILAWQLFVNSFFRKIYKYFEKAINARNLGDEMPI